MKEKVSLARIYYPVEVLGPGQRVGIWLNGCSQRCDGCISPELQSYDISKEIYVDDIIRMINKIPGKIDGFTISGGEPFYQPGALAELVKKISVITDDIIIFTGYTLKELKKMNLEAVNSVIATCSVIIDGPFIESLKDVNGLRGSSNQKIWVFKHNEKYKEIYYWNYALQTVKYGDTFYTIGIPREERSD